MDKRVVILLVLMTLVYGCSSGGSGDTSSQSTPFVGGTTGITFDFEEGAPPDEFYDGDNYPFDVNVMVKNYGEDDILAGELHYKFGGFLPSDFGIDSADMRGTNDEILEGTEKDADGNVLRGTEIDMGVDGLQYQGQLTGNIEFPIKVDVCYPYQTKVNAKVCYKEDFTDYTDVNICDPRGTKETYNSGAPVHVTEFTEDVIGSDRISLVFRIEKVANGNLWNQRDVGYNCGWDLTGADGEPSERELEDRVFVTVSPGTGDTLICQALGENACSGNTCAGEIKLNNGYRVVRCSLNVGTDIDYEKVADITLDYSFEETKHTTILGKHGV